MPPRSPLAPTAAPQLPAIAGVRLAARACGVRYKGRTDVCLMEFAPGTTIAGVLTRSLSPSAPVDWCRAGAEGRQGSRHPGQFRQCQCLHRQAGEGLGGAQRRRRRPPRSAVARNEVFIASTGVIGEPLPDERITAALPRSGGRAWPSRRLGGRGRGHHDHRHLPQGRDAHGEDRRGRGPHQRHRQGLGHDRARHGDHAGLRRHRRACRPACCAALLREATRPVLQLHRRWTATPRPATRCCWRRPARSGPCRHRPGRRPAAGGFPRQAGRIC